LGLPSFPATEAMLTIRPQPASRMSGTTARQQRKTPLTSISMTCRHASTG
jgi:hypothetical protein